MNSFSFSEMKLIVMTVVVNLSNNRVIRKVIGSFGVRYFRDSLYAVSLSVTGKYPKFAKIPHPYNRENLQLLK